MTYYEWYEKNKDKLPISALDMALPIPSDLIEDKDKIKDKKVKKEFEYLYKLEILEEELCKKLNGDYDNWLKANVDDLPQLPEDRADIASAREILAYKDQITNPKVIEDLEAIAVFEDLEEKVEKIISEE